MHLATAEKALTEEKQRRFVAQAVLERDDIVDYEWIQWQIHRGYSLCIECRVQHKAHRNDYL